jgi:GNAT superfamily N-acetyltransferase
MITGMGTSLTSAAFASTLYRSTGNELIMRSTGVQIRPFEPKDQAAARGLVLAGLEEHFGRLNSALNSDLDDIMQYYVRAGHLFVVAEEQKEIVGTGGLKIADRVGSMVRVSVSSQWRRKGIGRALVMHLLELASHLRLKEVIIQTNHWPDAISLYQRCGFTESARDKDNVVLFRQLPTPPGINPNDALAWIDKGNTLRTLWRP